MREHSPLSRTVSAQESGVKQNPQERLVHSDLILIPDKTKLSKPIQEEVPHDFDQNWSGGVCVHGNRKAWRGLPEEHYGDKDEIHKNQQQSRLSSKTTHKEREHQRKNCHSSKPPQGKHGVSVERHARKEESGQ